METEQGVPYPATGLSRRTRLLVAGFLFVGALEVRLAHFTDLPLDFRSNRQYRCAVLARSFYVQATPSSPQWQKDLSQANLKTLEILEPPIVEYLVAAAYRLAGREHLWIARIFSVVFWLVGGVFLLGIARRIVSAEGALCSVGFYLLWPFAVTASRSFQPDPLMMMLLLLALLLMLRHHERPTVRGVLGAALAAGAAMFVKPVCAPVIFATFAALAIRRHTLSGALIQRHSLLFAAVSVPLCIAWYLRALLGAGGLHSQAHTFLMSNLLLESFFWKDWFGMILEVVGPTFLIAALAGSVLFRPGTPRTAIIGLWVGYVLFGLVFPYHMHTHNYYQLQLLPIVALGVAPIGEHVLRDLVGVRPAWLGRLALAALVLALTCFSRLMTPYMAEKRYVDEVADAEKIGQLVRHSTRAIFLSYHYGNALSYHGRIAGLYWPSTQDLRVYRMEGRPPEDVASRLARLREPNGADYFIVTDLGELDRQSDLKEFLTGRYPKLAQTERYVVFDMRGSAGNQG